MSNVYEWPLPYLIKPTSPTQVDVFLDPLPDQRILRDDLKGVGAVEMRLGGPTWDVRAGVVDSVKDVVPSLITGVVSVSVDDLPDYFLQEGLVFVSDRFREVCEPFIKNAEFLPAAFRTSTAGADSLGGGVEVNNYYWLNTWNRIDLVDLDRSTFAPNNLRPGPRPDRPARISSWKQLVLKPVVGVDDHLFGIMQIAGEERYCSIELRDAVVSGGLRVQFEPIPLEVGPDILKRRREYAKHINSNDLILGPPLETGTLMALAIGEEVARRLEA
ncbi:imm11 family protein [Caulobacter sp. LARHSG274]